MLFFCTEDPLFVQSGPHGASEGPRFVRNSHLTWRSFTSCIKQRLRARSGHCMNVSDLADSSPLSNFLHISLAVPEGADKGGTIVLKGYKSSLVVTSLIRHFFKDACVSCFIHVRVLSLNRENDASCCMTRLQNPVCFCCVGKDKFSANVIFKSCRQR